MHISKFLYEDEIEPISMMLGGKSMSLKGFIEACENDENIELTHLICTSKDQVLGSYVKAPYKMDSLKLFFSMTKSFASLAIGIAWDLKLLDIDDFIYNFFYDELPIDLDKNLRKIRIRHLLTMSSGIHDNTYSELFVQENWTKAFLRQEFPHEPGTYYRYSTHGSHMLSAIIEKVSGLSLENFLNKYLFHPLNIFEAQWEISPEGYTAGGMGLSLYPMSLVKIAQMILNGGIYENKVILSEEYIQMATVKHIIKQDDLNSEDKEYSGYEYGFQFHIGKNGYFRMDGAFGQLCLICPEKNLAIIVFSQYSKIENLLEQIYNHLFDDDFEDIFSKDNRINSLKTEPSHRMVINKKYSLDRNTLNIHSFEVLRNEEGYSLILDSKNRKDTIRFSLNECIDGKIYFMKDLQEHLQKYVCYAKYDDELKLTLYLIETPYILTYRIRFLEDKVKFDFHINVSFNIKDFSVFGTRVLENKDLSEIKD